MSKFDDIKLNDRGRATSEYLTTMFTNLLTTVEHEVPGCRERSLVQTKLQEAAFWAREAVAASPKNRDGYAEPEVLMVRGDIEEERAAIAAGSPTEKQG